MPDDETPDAAHLRPDGVDDATIAALGKLSEALEVVEHARGLLYGFHRLTGKADLALGEAVDLLREAGHDEHADAGRSRSSRTTTTPTGRSSAAARRPSVTRSRAAGGTSSSPR
jgi:hypothetical protein